MINSVNINHYHTIRNGNKIKTTEQVEVLLFFNDEREEVIFPAHVHNTTDGCIGISDAVKGSIVNGVFTLQDHFHTNDGSSEKTFYTINMKYNNIF